MQNFIIPNFNISSHIAPPQATSPQVPAYKYALAEYLGTEFENKYWQYQQGIAQNNFAGITPTRGSLSENLKIGRDVMNVFDAKYPQLESYTMADALARQSEKEDPNSLKTKLYKNKADRLFPKMIKLLEKRPDNKNITFNQYINLITKEFDESNHGNCAERAYYIHKLLNQKGITNQTIVEIGGKKNHNSHVFNVVGIATNADITNPSTWGQNAVVIDTWANKLYTVQQALNFYEKFLDYGSDNPMTFEEFKINDMFKSY